MQNRIHDRAIKRKRDRNSPRVAAGWRRSRQFRCIVPKDLGIQRSCALNVGIAEECVGGHVLVDRVLYIGAGGQGERHRHADRIGTTGGRRIRPGTTDRPVRGQWIGGQRSGPIRLSRGSDRQ